MTIQPWSHFCFLMVKQFLVDTILEQSQSQLTKKISGTNKSERKHTDETVFRFKKKIEYEVEKTNVIISVHI